MEKKLWCVSIKHEEDVSETIHLVRSETPDQARTIAFNNYVENNGFYQGDREHFEEDLENETITVYAFEVRDEDILEEK
jgi:hypothetical protein